jgi:hypothetical protein
MSMLIKEKLNKKEIYILVDLLLKNMKDLKIENHHSVFNKNELNLFDEEIILKKLRYMIR